MSKTLFYFIINLYYFFALPFQQFTGTWLKGKDMPMEFVTVPEHYVLEKKLMICDRYVRTPVVYVYNSELNEWDTVEIKLSLFRIVRATRPKSKNRFASCYFGEYYSLCIM